MESNNLEKLIALCKKGDRQGQNLLYKNLYGMMFATCRRYIPDYDKAAEIMNSAFFKVLTKIGNFTGKGSFEGWVKKITVNTAIDYIRSDKKYKEQIILDEKIEEKNYYIDEEDFNEISLEEIYKMINQLPLMSRTVFNLYVIEGYKHMEIGEELQISEGTSKWHLSFARQKLRDLINNKEIQNKK